MAKRNFNQMTDEDLLNFYESRTEAASLGEAQGGRRGVFADRFSNQADRARGVLDRRGVDYSGLDIADFSSGVPSLTDAQGANSLLTSTIARQMRGQGKETQGLAALSGNKLQAFLADRQKEENTQFYDQKIDPQFERATEIANQIASTKAISAQQEADLRSKISAQVTQAAATNQRRVGAIFGLRGFADSPASAAIAQRAGAEYDTQLVNTLRDMGIDVAEINREAQVQDVGTLSQLATSRIAARNASIAGDQATTLALQGQASALIQAIQDRRKVLDLLEKQYEDATDESFMDRFSQWTSAARGVTGLAMGGLSAINGISSLGQSPVADVANPSAAASQGYWAR